MRQRAELGPVIPRPYDFINSGTWLIMLLLVTQKAFVLCQLRQVCLSNVSILFLYSDGLYNISRSHLNVSQMLKRRAAGANHFHSNGLHQRSAQNYLEEFSHPLSEILENERKKTMNIIIRQRKQKREGLFHVGLGQNNRIINLGL